MRTSTVEGHCQSRRHWVFSQHCLQEAYLALPGSSQILRPREFTGRRRMAAAGHKTPVGQASLWARGSPGVFTPTPLPEQRLRLCRRVNRLCAELLGSSDTIDSWLLAGFCLWAADSHGKASLSLPWHPFRKAPGLGLQSLLCTKAGRKPCSHREEQRFWPRKAGLLWPAGGSPVG